jgi:fatty-acyl-CoA synthase
VELPGIKEAAVLGVPDEQWGEVGHLFWVSRGDDAFSQERIKEFLNFRLARYKIPKHYTKISALPRNGAGKVMKNQLTANSV